MMMFGAIKEPNNHWSLIKLKRFWTGQNQKMWPDIYAPVTFKIASKDLRLDIQGIGFLYLGTVLGLHLGSIVIQCVINDMLMYIKGGTLYNNADDNSLSWTSPT